MNNPLVSAVITSYKRPVEIVSNAIESVKNQTYGSIEILLIDDNEDDSVESRLLKNLILEKYPDVKYIKQDGNQGACAARNLGIKYSKGDYVGFLDDDDEWLPNKTEIQLKRFNDCGNELAMVYGPGICCDHCYNPAQKYPYNNPEKIKTYLSFERLLYGDCVGSTSMPLIKKSALVTLGGFTEGLPARQDYELWLRIARNYRISGVREPLFIHNMHSGEQISKNPIKSYAGYSYVYKEFHKEYLRDLKAHRNIYRYIHISATEAKVKGHFFITTKYYLIAILDEIRKKLKIDRTSYEI